MLKFTFKIVSKKKGEGENIHLKSVEDTMQEGSLTSYEGVKSDLSYFLGVCPIRMVKRSKVEEAVVRALNFLGYKFDDVLDVLRTIKEGLSAYRVEPTSVPVTLQFRTLSGIEITVINH